MVKIKNVNNWKDVTISQNLDLGNIDLHGLLGLEVLENYDNDFITSEKRKVEETNDSDNADDDYVSKKKKQKNSNAIKTRNRLNDNTSNESGGGKYVLIKPQIDSDEEITNDINDNELAGWNELGVPPLIMKAIAKNKFVTPTQIQELTIPPAIFGRRDILGAAETGSGKTLAFGIPVLNGILELKTKSKDNLDSEKPLYALILTPTRELAVQIRDHLKKISIYTDIKIAAIFGGLAALKQERQLKQCPEIVVATPGRLWELLENGNPHLNKIDNIKYLVVDETDRMVERGHFEELTLVLERINKDEMKKKNRQNFIFSATLTMVHDLPNHLKQKNKNWNKQKKLKLITPGAKLQNLIQLLGIQNPKIIDITQKFATAELLTECRIFCTLEQKDYYLYYFIKQHPGRTIVFCNSIECVKRLSQLFLILDCKPYPLHANMNQKQRLKNLERFTSDPLALLIATDVAARGLDIPNIKHVIHYQVPRTAESYVHRSGRTARAKQEGITVLIMEDNELNNYVKLCNSLGKSEDIPSFPVSSQLLASVKERVNLAREIDYLELKSRRILSDIGWKEKAAVECDIIIDDMNNTDSDDDIVSEKRDIQIMKKTLKAKHGKLAKMLSQTLFTRNMNSRFPTSSGHLDMAGNGGSAIDTMKTAILNIKADKKLQNKSKQWKLNNN